MPTFSLRAWLRRRPQPHSIRMKLEDGEERAVKLGDNHRHKWTAAAETVENARPHVVECLDSTGEILRSHAFEWEEDDEPDKHGETAEDKREDAQLKRFSKLLQRERQELAQSLDVQGDNMIKAFHAGKDASAVGQQKLIELVESTVDVVATFANHIAVASTNMISASVNFANLVNQLGVGGDEGDPNKPTDQHKNNGEMLMRLLLAKLGDGGGGSDERQTKTNGAKGK